MSGDFSKSALNQQGWTLYLQSADRVHRRQVNEAIVSQYGALSGTLTLATLEQECVWEQEVLEALRVASYEAEQGYVAEVGDDPAVKQEDDDAKAALRVELIDNRMMFAGSFGAEATAAAGFRGETPATGAALIAYSEASLRAMEAAPQRVNRVGVMVDLTPYIQRQRAAHDRAKASQVAVDNEARELQEARRARDEAQARLRAMYVLVAQRMEARFRLAGLDELADRLRPTSRRVASVEEPPAPLVLEPVAGA